MAVRSQQELLDAFFLEVQNRDPSLTDDSEGSKLDVIAGAVTTAVAEIQRTTVDEFKKTFIDTADGPEVTGGTDDLERLLVDHFGDDFARPEKTPAVGEVRLSRPNADAGTVTILAGTVVKTAQSATGKVQRFVTLSDVTMAGTIINASVEAVVAGPEGNVEIGTVVEIETALTDSSITVTNLEAFSGGANTLTDAEYRQFARNLLKSKGGGSLEAIEAAALTVPGISYAKGLEFVKFVKEWDIANDVGTGDYFRIVYPVLYVGDANGNASQPLLDAVAEAVDEVRAGGVRVVVNGFTAISLNWTLAITLDSGGPNYAELSVDPQPIIDTMTSYLQDLGVGDDFDKSAADAYILAQWGPAGTGDLTAAATTVPSGDVAVGVSEKIIPGTVEIA